MNLCWAMTFAVFLAGSQLLANTRVELLEPLYSGNGCPLGSADVSLLAGAKRIDITFDKFSVEADNALGRVVAKKECDVTIKIKIPHGFSLAVEKVRYNGISRLPFGSNAHFVGAHYFNHEQVAAVNKRYYGQTSSAFDISSRVSHQALFWSPCGEDAEIFSRTNIAVSSVKSLFPASIQVDDLQPGLSYYLLWRPCSEQRIR